MQALIKSEWLEAINGIEYRNWKYQILAKPTYEYLQITFEEVEQDGVERILWCERNIGHDTHDKGCYDEVPKYKRVTQYCRKWLLSNDMTTSDIIRTAWMATLIAEEHEAREKFRYKGKKIFNPHFNLEKLVDLVGYKENLEIKELVGA